MMHGQKNIKLHNCFIKLVPLVIFIYDARSHIRQISVLYCAKSFYNPSEHKTSRSKCWQTSRRLWCS